MCSLTAMRKKDIVQLHMRENDRSIQTYHNASIWRPPLHIVSLHKVPSYAGHPYNLIIHCALTYTSLLSLEFFQLIQSPYLQNEL